MLRVATGVALQEQARSARPDCIVIAGPLPDLDDVEACRALRKQGLITPSTPIVLVTATPATRERRLAGLRAGGWDQLSPFHSTPMSCC